MQNKKYDIAIAYRIYPKISKETAIYSDNKYLLSEFCLYSFAKSLKGIRAKIFVILDNCPSEYDDLFKKYLKDFDYELIQKDGIGNAETFNLQMDLLLNQDYSDIIYFAEDDYFYLDNAFRLMIDFIKTSKADFISPYDHPDYYNLVFHETHTEIEFYEIHWRRAISTTMTFMTTKRNLQESKSVFDSYIKDNSDASLWATISGNQFRSVRYIARNVLKDKSTVRYLIKSYYYNPLSLLFKKKYKLMVPLPSISVHMEKKFLSPGIDWFKHFELIKNEIKNIK